MDESKRPVALDAHDNALPTSPSNYPAAFLGRVAGRGKRRLGDAFGLKNFGVNLTRLEPGAISALHHRHSKQEEFVYIVSGEATLVTDAGETRLAAGMCAGFPAGGSAHHLVNRSERAVIYLEIGDRSTGDQVVYPDDDIAAVMGADGKWRFTRKDGTPY
ncbi:MAG: cupin domain-containing protein [Alphaproteobacteria bacterium]|nr:cupin domain-containing protein [Alphaproteobacteria bacterium]